MLLRTWRHHWFHGTKRYDFIATNFDVIANKNACNKHNELELYIGRCWREWARCLALSWRKERRTCSNRGPKLLSSPGMAVCCEYPLWSHGPQNLSDCWTGKTNMWWVFLCPRIEWSGAYCFCPVCLFVCLSVCLFVAGSKINCLNMVATRAPKVKIFWARNKFW